MWPLSFSNTFGLPFSMIATQEFVVPRSMPIIRESGDVPYALVFPLKSRFNFLDLHRPVFENPAEANENPRSCVKPSRKELRTKELVKVFGRDKKGVNPRDRTAFMTLTAFAARYRTLFFLERVGRKYRPPLFFDNCGPEGTQLDVPLEDRSHVLLRFLRVQGNTSTPLLRLRTLLNPCPHVAYALLALGYRGVQTMHFPLVLHQLPDLVA